MNRTIFNKSSGLIQTGPGGEGRQDLLTAHYDEGKAAHAPHVSDVPGPGTSLKFTKTFSKEEALQPGSGFNKAPAISINTQCLFQVKLPSGIYLCSLFFGIKTARELWVRSIF